MKRLIIFLCLLLSINIFAQTKNHMLGKTFVLRSDTLKPRVDKCPEETLKKKSLKLKNIYISPYYTIIDSLEIDLNNDKKMDKILVLSPETQENNEPRSKCYNRDFNRRLLLILMTSGNYYKVKTINENIILNTLEFQSDPFRRIEKDRKGFILKFFLGTSRRCYYDFHFKVFSNEIFLNKVNYNCYIMDLTKSKKGSREYKKSNRTNISKIDIRPFIIYPNL